jgi:hypothetical protein
VRATPHNDDLPGEIEQALTDRRVDAAIIGIIRDVARARSIELTNPNTQDLALAAAHDAYAAMYATRTTLSIALEPSDARRLHDNHGFRLEAANDTTHYIHIAKTDLDDEALRPVVLDTLEAAVDRSFHGPRWNRGLDDQAQPWGDLCPVHSLPKNLRGECDDCA